MNGNALAWMGPGLFYVSATGFLILRQRGYDTAVWALAFGLIGSGYAVTLIPPPHWSGLKPLIEDALFLAGAVATTVAFTRRFGLRPRFLPKAIIVAGGLGAAAIALNTVTSVRLETFAIQAACTALLVVGLIRIRRRVIGLGDKVVFRSFSALAAVLAVQCLGYLAAPEVEPVVGAWGRTVWGLVFQATGIAMAVLLTIAVLSAIGLDIIEQLERTAGTDALTGILNRRAFEQTALRLRQVVGPDQASSVIVADLDRFKSINDAHGHAGGDLVIVEMARLLQQISGPAICVGRTGGEEFAVFLAGIGLSQAHAIAEDIRSGFARIRWPGTLAQQSFTTSLGVAALRPADALADALREADDMLYTAKSLGRDRVVSPLSAPAPELSGSVEKI